MISLSLIVIIFAIICYLAEYDVLKIGKFVEICRKKHFVCCHGDVMSVLYNVLHGIDEVSGGLNLLIVSSI